MNPILFATVGRIVARAQTAVDARGTPEPSPPQTDLVPTALMRHCVIVGYGRVGQALAAGLRASGHAMVVIEDQPDLAEQARALGLEALAGNAATPAVLQASGIAFAQHLFVAVPDGFEAGQVVEQARQSNPGLDIVARAHSDEEVEHLKRLGANGIIMGERELARGMLDHALHPKAFAVAAAAAQGDAPMLGPRASAANLADL